MRSSHVKWMNDTLNVNGNIWETLFYSFIIRLTGDTREGSTVDIVMDRENLAKKKKGGGRKNRK